MTSHLISNRFENKECLFSFVSFIPFSHYCLILTLTLIPVWFIYLLTLLHFPSSDCLSVTISLLRTSRVSQDGCGITFDISELTYA